jgi:hypothetical protein
LRADERNLAPPELLDRFLADVPDDLSEPVFDAASFARWAP